MSRDLDRALHYHSIGYYQPAVDAYDKVLAADPTNWSALAKRAENYVLLGRFIDAERDYRAVAVERSDSSDWVNMALALECQGHYDSAMIAYDEALKINPQNPFAHFNKGVCLERDLGRHGEGVPYFERALAINPTATAAQGGMAFYQLKTGDFANGWRNFEWRTRDKNATRLPGLRWDGVPTDDLLILVCEQGLGDVLQFCRYAVLAAVNGQRTAIYAPPEFAPLLSSLGHGVQILTRPDEVVEPYQWTYMMSMPLHLGTQVGSIPSAKRYLRSDAARIEHWSNVIRTQWPDKFRIGICWHPGHPQNPHVAGRVIPLEMFKDIAALPNVQLFSLQKGPASVERDSVDFEVVDLGGDPVDRTDLFMDAAAIMESLDLVISTDTSVLHLSGAVGCRTFVMVPKGNCWRWFIDRTDSPWYPAMTLFRQKEIHEWGDVFARMAKAIGAMQC